MTINNESKEILSENDLVAIRIFGSVTLPTGTIISFSDHQKQSYQSAATRARNEINHRKNNFRGLDNYPENVSDGIGDAEMARETLKAAIADLDHVIAILKSNDRATS